MVKHVVIRGSASSYFWSIFRSQDYIKVMRGAYLRCATACGAAYRIACIAGANACARWLPAAAMFKFHPAILTAELLTSVLRQKGVLGGDDVVVSFVAADMEGGNIGKMSRITLSYKFGSRQTTRQCAPPETLIVKQFGTRVRDSVVASMIPLARNEHLAYSNPDLVDLLRTLQPVVYYCEVSHFGLGLIIMEDLSPFCKSKKSRDGASLDELGMVWSAAATLHSRTLMCSSSSSSTGEQDCDAPDSSSIDRLAGMLEWTGPLFDQQILSSVNLLSGPWELRLRPFPRLQHAIRQLQNAALVDELHVRLRGFGVHTSRPLHCRPVPFCALVHGDARLDNCFFDTTRGTVRFVDWQTVALRSPMQDVGWSLIDCSFDAMGMCLPLHVVDTASTTNPYGNDDGEQQHAITAAAEACRGRIYELLQTHYLNVLSQEIAANSVRSTSPPVDVPTIEYCKEMLPWMVFFCVMTFAGSCGGGVVVDDPTDPVMMTFSAYMKRMEWLLLVFVDDAFWRLSLSTKQVSRRGVSRDTCLVDKPVF